VGDRLTLLGHSTVLVDLDATMHRLDAQEQAMRERAVPDAVPAEVASGYLRELSKTWQGQHATKLRLWQ